MGGGGGDGGQQMMMMLMMQQQMQAQLEAQKAEAKKQAFASAQRGENQNYQRFQDLVDEQNKKVGDQWDLYNTNLDKILAIDPTWNAHQKYQFNPYEVNGQYKRGTDEASANENQDLLNRWYGDIDQQSLADFNMAKSQYEASKQWLTDAQNSKDAAGRLIPGALPGQWGAGGNQVSGGAGIDGQTPTQQTGNEVGGTNAMNAGVFSGIGSSGTAGAQTAGTGFISDPAKPAQQSGSSLSNVFANATGPKTSSGGTIF